MAFMCPFLPFSSFFVLLFTSIVHTAPVHGTPCIYLFPFFYTTSNEDLSCTY